MLLAFDKVQNQIAVRLTMTRGYFVAWYTLKHKFVIKDSTMWYEK